VLAHEERLGRGLLAARPTNEPPERAAYRAYLEAAAGADGHGGGSGGRLFPAVAHGFQTRDGAVKARTREEGAAAARAREAAEHLEQRAARHGEAQVTAFFAAAGLLQFRLGAHRWGLDSMDKVCLCGCVRREGEEEEEEEEEEEKEEEKEEEEEEEE